MFDKLKIIQNQKIETLQKELFTLNQDIISSKEKIEDLKNNIDFNHDASNIGSFMAISIHHKSLQENIKLEELKIIQINKNIVLTKKKIALENLQLQKFKHILDEEKKARLEKIKYKEALELDEFLQKA